MLIRIKNAQLAHAENVSIPFSKPKFAIANILKNTGFVSEVERKKKSIKEKAEHDYIEITLKYIDNESRLSDIKIISKPSRRMYMKALEIRPVRSDHGIAIISTSKGIMTSKEAKKQKLGGEILCEVY